MTSRDDRDIDRLLRGKKGRAYWRALRSLADKPAFADYLRREWPRQAALWDHGVDRRAVLRMIGATLALSGLAGCGRPDEEIVPYVVQPDGVVPAVPRYYATALTLDGYAHGVLAETYEGRPTRIRGNPDHPVNRGACSAFDSAAILGLYDPGRSQSVRHDGRIAHFDGFLAMLVSRRAAWQQTHGAGVGILSGRIASPTLLDRLEAVRSAYPALRWYRFEAIDRGAAREAATNAFGTPLEPLYRLAEARVVMSLDSDFLAPEEPGHLAYAADFASARRVVQGGRPPCRLYVVESTPGLAGAAADHVQRAAPSRVETLAHGLAVRLGIAAGRTGESEAEAAWLDVAANDLLAHAGRAPVIAGIAQPPAVHALAHAINDRLGNVGRTIAYIAPLDPPADGGLGALVRDVAAGRIDTLIMLDGNPVHRAPGDIDFAQIMRRVPLTIHWGRDYDATARRASWHVPGAHALESWGDARAFDGTVSLQQPLLAPLYGGRTAAEVLAAMVDPFEVDAYRIVRRYWRRRYAGGDFEMFWRSALKRGVVEGTAAEPVTPRLAGGITQLSATAAPAAAAAPDSVEIRLQPDPAVWDGRFADNGWLQELPRPLTKLVWGNAAAIAPARARRMGIENGQVIQITVGGRAVAAPAWVLPGQPEDCVAVTLGYGGPDDGPVPTEAGFDAYPLRTLANPWFVTGARIAVTDRHVPLVTTQHHHTVEGRGLVRRADWRGFVEDPDFAHRSGGPPEHSLYPEPSPIDRGPGSDGATPYAWGMVIDFGACIGCNACVVACQSENNIPIVGREEVSRGREMHWLRIDRYYGFHSGASSTHFQPVPCMHCENAPCEYVCPVEATQHSSEGLNEMVYNRCIGTRYCSQNCPYKVRRFNWFDYTGRGARFPAVAPLQNPQVTVRSRGVMEKCTYCVQRINRARIAADRDGRTIAPGEVETACQEACPTRAVVFGNLNQPQEAVRRMKGSPRNYAMLGELNTRPRTTYLAAVRNPHPDLGDGDGHGGG